MLCVRRTKRHTIQLPVHLVMVMVSQNRRLLILISNLISMMFPLSLPPPPYLFHCLHPLVSVFLLLLLHLLPLLSFEFLTLVGLQIIIASILISFIVLQSISHPNIPPYTNAISFLYPQIIITITITILLLLLLLCTSMMSSFSLSFSTLFLRNLVEVICFVVHALSFVPVGIFI